MKISDLIRLEQERKEECVILKTYLKVSESYPCHICERPFKRRRDMRRHLHIHSSNFPYKCQKCDDKFKLKAYLVRHMKKHGKIEDLPCQISDKIFHDKSNLKMHIRTHTDERPYISRVCNMTLRNTGNEKKQKIDPLYNCEFGKEALTMNYAKDSIGKVDTSKRVEEGKAEDHEQIGNDDTSRKPHQCKTCPAKFQSTSDFFRHTRVHTGERPYVSRFCKRTFKSTGNRSAHEKKHKVDPLYNCEIKKRGLGTKP